MKNRTLLISTLILPITLIQYSVEKEKNPNPNAVVTIKDNSNKFIP